MGKLAFVFPGQGAQSVGMMRDLYDNYETAKNVIDRLDEVVKDVMFYGQPNVLKKTVNAQPAIFGADLAVAALLAENGIEADGAAGFSVGEVAALVNCGILSFEQGLDYVTFRARAMRDAARENRGGMAAVLGLAPDVVVRICSGIDGVYVANFNAPLQTVVAFADNRFANGERVAYDILEETVKENGGKILRLAVSGPFHCPFMDEAAAKAESYLTDISDVLRGNKPNKPLYMNLTARVYEESVAESNAASVLAKQIVSPVKWTETITNMINDGFDTFVEAGPGKILTGFIAKIDPNVKLYNVFDIKTLENTVRELKC